MGQNGPDIGITQLASALSINKTTVHRLLSAMQNALQSTSLGTSVAFVTGSPTEGYYCINTSNALQYVSDVSFQLCSFCKLLKS